jgi:hypothetical protein
MVLLSLARSRNWSAADALEQGRALGLAVEGNLRMMVEEYLQRSESDRAD